MDDILDKVRDAVEAPIDFQGQQLAQTVNYAMLIASGIISFIIGFVTENVYNTVWAGCAGVVITMLAVVPPWPFYNKRPVNWLPPRRVGSYWVEPVAPAKKAS